MTSMVPKSRFLVWLNLAISVVIAGIGFIMGFIQGQPAQLIIVYTIVSLVVLLWGFNYVAVIYENSSALKAEETEESKEKSAAQASNIWRTNKVLIFSMAALLILYLLLTASINEFRTIGNLVAFLLLELILLFAFKVSRVFVYNRSAFIGVTILVAIFAISSFTIDGFLSGANIKSILLFAAFLGIASIGQTLVALLGGLDLSIPFVIGSSNIGLLYLIGLGIPPWVAVIFVLILGGFVGFLNGVLSYRLQGQALILTLGMGFAISGLTQILTSIGSSFSGNVFGKVPGWLRNLAAMNGETFGLNFPPIILIWAVLAILLIIGLRRTAYGRHVYALGGNRQSAKLQNISEFKYWTLAYISSGVFSAMTGSLLLGWSGGGFIGVGEPYLFATIAAVVIGGTSLLGGYGGYGFTVIGVLVLQVLTFFLIGIGLDYEWQQFIFGLLILPIVALYGRFPHIRTQI
ncbi:MAG: ABC transporter permease [Anaerolineae bacterium]|nr:ABC transporter permease [Anaerolineae bacterium]